MCVESNAALESGRCLTDARNPLFAVGEDTCRLCFNHHRELTDTHTGHTGSLCKGKAMHFISRCFGSFVSDRDRVAWVFKITGFMLCVFR